MPYIAVVDDEEDIREILSLHLTRGNFEVRCFESGDAFIKSLSAKVPDAAILDIMMEHMNGYEVLSAIKKKYPGMGVLFLTAKSQTLDKVLGLDLGADDYMTKPFVREELISRVKALLRRSGKTPAGTGSKKNLSGIYQHKGLIFNAAEKTLTLEGKPVKITKTEFLLLKLLSASPQKIFTRDEILESVWDDAVVNERTIDVHIRRLRKKLGQAYENLIQTHSGFGYSMDEPVSAE